MLDFLIPASAFLILAISAYHPDCLDDSSPGTSEGCAEASPSTKFFFDGDTAQCLAFHYNGCGGNDNRFDDPQSCMDKCIGDPLMFYDCPLNRPPLMNERGSPLCDVAFAVSDSESDSDSGTGCDNPNAYCKKYNTEGMCCDKRVDEAFVADKSNTCPNGKAKLEISVAGSSIAMLGKYCETIECPVGYSCQKGNFYHFCCADD